MFEFCSDNICPKCGYLNLADVDIVAALSELLFVFEIVVFLMVDCGMTI